MNCINCGIEVESKRKDAKFCSSKCRVTFSRKSGIVTDNVTLSDPIVTDNFEFIVSYNKKPGDEGFDQQAHDKHKTPRTAKYWYDVPISAIPVIKEGNPKMPDFMNGRQYFLWWKNEFQVDDKGDPVILNPFPVYDKVEYVRAGEGSRRWGA